ncbi:MAG: hypothetical protein KAT85_05645, partial [candidate division Zixibacteria bacterium]|nr:hypothetical protein [candidate division Zixibacteria bacterium]
MRQADRYDPRALRWYPVSLLACVLLLIAFNTSPGQSVPVKIYVSVNGDDGGDGSIANPYKTIGWAISAEATVEGD